MSQGVRATMIALAVLCSTTTTVAAQVTTGTVTGTIQDSQGGVIPGATVVLISESRGTRGVPAVTNATGDYVLPNITPDTYTVEVTMPGFRLLRRTGVPVSGGERVAVGILVVEPGGATETVDVTAEAPLIQAASGERSYTVSSSQIDNLPLALTRNYTDLTRLVPGVVPGGDSSGGTRLGGAGQNNITMDGISALEVGSNNQILRISVESIAEIKVLTQGYQAEYGRNSGLQIATTTKSGSNKFRGGLYDIEDNSDWNTQNWAERQNGDPKSVSKGRIYGYSLGGPVGRPGGRNKLFFFYSHEYQPTTTSGSVNRFRVPTERERVGDFSQSLDNQGRPIPQLKSPITGLPYPNNVIPQNELYSAGLGILNSFPLPNLQQTAPNSYNLQAERPEDKNLVHQPAIRLDYQFSPALRLNARWLGRRERERIIQGTLPGFNDVLFPWPYRHVYGTTVNYTINGSTFLEGTYGSAFNNQAGGGPGGYLSNPTSNRLDYYPNLPLIYPQSGLVDQNSFQAESLARAKALGGVPFFDGTSVNLPPTFGFGSLVGSAPPTLDYPGFITKNVSQDVAISLTKIAGRHTLKAGFYYNYADKPQSVGAGVGGAGSFQGSLSFANDTNNPLDTGYGFANAATGVFTSYSQISRLLEGYMTYNNTEFYLQDNWRATNRLTLDYGMRFTHQSPMADKYGNMSNFFPNLWARSAAPLLYVPGCKSGATVCSGNDRNARNPVTGEILVAPGANNTASAIGTVIAGSGNVLNGIRQAGDGISNDSYTWPAMVFGPRFGLAYDLSGKQSLVVRGGAGLFYDRPDGNTVFAIPGNPPMAESQTLTNGMLQTLGQGLKTVGASNLVIFQYDAKIPSSVQWNAGVQMALPWAMSLDTSYVGNYGYNRLGGFQGGTLVNLNQVNLGAAYLPQNQDSTLTPNANATPGSLALSTNLLRPYRGLGTIQQNTTDFYDKYHSLQMSLNRRFRGGLAFGANYTWSFSFVGNTGLTKRLQHNPDGSFTERADQQAYEDLNKTLAIQPHVLRGNMVWDLPDLADGSPLKRAVGLFVNDWQLSGLFNLSSGTNYNLQYSYQTNGTATNLTGSPDFGNNGTGARIVYVTDPGSGCSGDRYAQFDTTSVTGPTYGSVGLESGRNRMRGCLQREVDLSLARDIQLGGGRRVTLRMDAFNAFNIVNYNGRNSTISYNNPVQKQILNSQFLADGSLDQTRLTPRNAGFGAVTSAGDMRTVRLTARFSF